MKRLLTPLIICCVAATAVMLSQLDGAEDTQASAPKAAIQTPPGPAAATTRRLTTTNAVRVAPDAGITLTPRWSLGERRRYRYEATHTVSVTLSGEALPAATIAVSGRWVATVAGIDEDQIHVRLVLEEPNLRLEPEESAAETRRTQDALNTPFYASYDTRGRLEALHFPPQMESFAQTIARSVAANMQLVAPATGPATGWQTEEADAMGEYTARYTHVGPGARFDRYKSDYVRVASAHGLVPATDAGDYTITGSSHLAADADGHLRTVSTDETVTMDAKTAGASMKSTVRVRAHRLDVGQDPRAAELLKTDWPTLRSTQVPDIDRIRQQIAAALDEAPIPSPAD